VTTHRATRRADLTVAKRYGVGGGVWTILVPTGDGVTADRTYAGTATWAGWIVEGRLLIEGVAAAGVPVGASKTWEAIGLSALPAPGSILQSVANPRLRFVVGASDVVEGYARAVVRPLGTT
jgi:hypothetical protein